MGKTFPKSYFYDIPAENITEKLIHHLWAEKVFAKYPLKTLDNKNISVTFPGFWNKQEGPDFKQTVISIGSKSASGDIEIHLYSSDWTRHNHQKDPRYNNVILHVAVWADDENSCVIDSTGRKIPQLVIAEWLAKEYEEIDGFLDADDYTRINARFGGIGDCSRYCLNESLHAPIKQYLNLLGEKRFDYKSGLFKYRKSLFEKSRQDSLISDYDELANQGIMEALGYQHNSKAFYELAKSLPLGLLRRILSEFESEDRTLLLQSSFLSQANLIPTNVLDKTDKETQIYLAEICNLYKKISDKVNLAPLGKNLTWRFKGTRPINYPQRRLAGISYFLSRYLHQGIFKHLLNSYDKPSSLLDSFNADSRNEYWLRRSTFGGTKFKKESPLVGEGTMRTIEINILLPLLLNYSEETKNKQLSTKAKQIITNYPKLPENHITRSMKYRLFADKTKVMNKFVRSAFDQQSLIQLFKDYCAKGIEGCKTCGLIRACLTIKPE